MSTPNKTVSSTTTNTTPRTTTTNPTVPTTSRTTVTSVAGVTGPVTTNQKSVVTPAGTTKNVGTVLPFDSINEPGAYVCNWSGHLLRVPEDAVTAGRTPTLNLVGTEPLFVTKISDNPHIPLAKAKAAAATFDVRTNF